MDLQWWRNRLIVFEGGDSNGKSSVANLLVDHLNNNNIETILTFQPGDTNWGPLASMFRSLCKDKRWNLHPLSNFFAFQLDRVEVTDKVVTPALAEGKTVISDRWNYSTYAYQMYGKELITKYGVPTAVLNWLMQTAITSRDPDYVFYFPEKIKSNRKDDKNDEFDNAPNDFMRRVDEAYERMYNHYDNWIRVNPGKSAEETLQKILNMEV